VRSLVRTVTAKAPVPYVSRAQNLLHPTLFRKDPLQSMDAYGSSGVLFAIVSRLAESTAGAQWRLYRTSRGGERVEVTDHLALRVLERPNPFTTRQELIESGQQHFELVGETVLVVARDPRATFPMELWNVRPDRITVVPSRTDFIAGYVYTSPDGEQVPLAREEVIFLRHPNPLDPYRGMGAVQTVLNHLDGEKYSAEWNRNFFVNGAVPGGVIEVEVRLSDAEFDEMTERWKEQHQGVANAGRVAFLEGGATYKPVLFTQKDMQFTELSVLGDDKVRRAFGFPKPMLGDTEDSNRAVAQAAEYVFAKWLIEPRLERWKQALNTEFLPMFGSAAAGLEFDYDSPVPEDAEADNAERANKVDAVVKLKDAGFDTDDILQWLDMPALTLAQTGSGKSRDIVEAVQKIYLGVGTVLTSDEARTILNDYGADLAVPGPSFPAPAPASPSPGGAGAVSPDEGQVAAIVRGVLLGGREARSGHGGRSHRTDPDDGEPWRAVAELPKAPAGIPASLPEGAGPDLGPVQEAWVTALDGLLAEWGGVTAAWVATLLAQVEAHVTAGDVVSLAAIRVDESEAAALLETAMLALGADAATRVVTEAAAQDVTVMPAALDRVRTAGTAQVFAAVLGGVLVQSTVREAVRVWAPGMTGVQVREQVAAHLGTLTDAQPRLVLGGALSGAQRDGRVATMTAGPSAALYANEVNDANQCGQCRRVDGKWLGNSDDPLQPWKATYPTGGYVHCEGRSRCRGTVVAIWRGGSDWRQWVEKEPVTGL
jgi:HK97 family phage portal protein